MRVIKGVLGLAAYPWEDPMDAILTDRDDLDYSGGPPILVVATSDEAQSLARLTIEASGLRLGAAMTLGEARERIERQAAATAVWVELDEDCGGPMDGLLEGLNRDVTDGRYSAVVSTTSALLDPVLSSIDQNAVELVVDGDESERAAALAIALARRSMPFGVADVAADQTAARLRQLSDEVSRIASTLSRLSTGPSSASRMTEPPQPLADVPDISVDAVRSVIRARRLRARYFPGELFADPAWDMLLDLLQAEISQLRVPVSSLCIAAAVPATTALRWLKTMVSEGIFIRRADPHDGRRVFVELAPRTSDALRAYFAEAGRVLVI